MVFYSQVPKWDPKKENWTMVDTSQRVVPSSFRNMELTAAGDKNRTILRFGRKRNGSFAVDYRSPMPPLQAFAIALSNIYFIARFE